MDLAATFKQWWEASYGRPPGTHAGLRFCKEVFFLTPMNWLTKKTPIRWDAIWLITGKS